MKEVPKDTVEYNLRRSHARDGSCHRILSSIFVDYLDLFGHPYAVPTRQSTELGQFTELACPDFIHS